MSIPLGKGRKIYLVEYLPVDICLGKDLKCSYQIREYFVDKVGKQYVWLTKMDSRIRPDRLVSRKFNYDRTVKYNHFYTSQDAIIEVSRRLSFALEAAKRSVDNCYREIALFDKEILNEESLQVTV